MMVTARIAANQQAIANERTMERRVIKMRHNFFKFMLEPFLPGPFAGLEEPFADDDRVVASDRHVEVGPDLPTLANDQNPPERPAVGTPPAARQRHAHGLSPLDLVGPRARDLAIDVEVGRRRDIQFVAWSNEGILVRTAAGDRREWQDELLPVDAAKNQCVARGRLYPASASEDFGHAIGPVDRHQSR